MKLTPRPSETGSVNRYDQGDYDGDCKRYEFETVDVVDYQGTSVMNYADEEVPFTRIHEPKHLHPERKRQGDKTVVIKEFSQVDDEAPYYPVNFDSDRKRLAQYQALQEKEERVIFGGRLAQYRYYDMHQVIASALKTAKDELVS